MQSIVNHMEREEERSIIGHDKRNSVHSDWSDLISIDEEAEYRKIDKNRKGPNTTSTATTSAASATEATMIPSSSLAKKMVKSIVLVPYTPRPKEWGSWQIRSPYAFKYCCKPICSTQTIKSRTEGRRIGQRRRGRRVGL